MRPILLLALTLATSCAAGPGGNWPSLARRPSEKIAADLAASPAKTAAQSEATVAAPSEVAGTRLAQIGQDLDSVEKRWDAQKKAADAAVAAGKRAAPDSQAWSTAQVQLTRLNKIGAQAADVRERLNTVAGDLASEAAKGIDVTAPLAAAGKLIARADALVAKHAAAQGELQLPPMGK